jgi:predicted GNAT family N-acyltransferase
MNKSGVKWKIWECDGEQYALIYDLFVNYEERGQGKARGLMLSVINDIGQKHPELDIELAVAVDGQEKWLTKFYNSLGFVEFCKTEKFIYMRLLIE